MPNTTIEIEEKDEMSLLTRKTAVKEILNNLSTAQLKNVAELSKRPKAQEYLSTQTKFALLKSFL